MEHRSVAGPRRRFRVVTFSKAIGGDYWQYSLGPTRISETLLLTTRSSWSLNLVTEQD